MKFAVKSRRVLYNEKLTAVSVFSEDGRIKDICSYNESFDCMTEDFGDLVIMPGLCDSHVHINEPGREDWEGFETATKAAAAGGITFIADMPLNSLPVTINESSFDKKTETAKDKLYCDTGFYGGLIPGNVYDLVKLSERGVLGIKAFMIESGLEEFPPVNETQIREALKVLKSYPDKKGSGRQNQIPLLVHAEIAGNLKPSVNYSKYSFKSFLEARPAEWESSAVEILIKLCREYNYHIHIVHVSAASSVELIRNAKKEGLPLTVETCPHYLYFSSEEIPDNNTGFKCTPPIRDSANREVLWDAVKDGTIDFVVSDHSPCNPVLKFIEEGNFAEAWGGISGLQFSLPVFWTKAKRRGVSVTELSELMSSRTSGFLSTGKRKGKIEKGYDSDFIVFDPEGKFTVEEKNIFHRHKVTPYMGEELYGIVEHTYLRGNKVFEKGKIVSDPAGEIILRERNS